VLNCALTGAGWAGAFSSLERFSNAPCTCTIPPQYTRKRL
jgi:hypothetical protein